MQNQDTSSDLMKNQDTFTDLMQNKDTVLVRYYNTSEEIKLQAVLLYCK